MIKGSYAYKQQRARLNQLLNIPYSQWAGIWCALNKYEYPKQLKYKPIWWDKKRLDDRKFPIVNELMQIIQWAVGERAIMDHWNKALPTHQKQKWFRLRFKDQIKTIQG